MGHSCRIAIDLLGAEHNAEELVKGANKGIRGRTDCELTFICDKDSLSSSTLERTSVLHCCDAVTDQLSLRRVLADAYPTSMSIGLRMLEAREVDGFVSVGSTGALMALGRHLLHTPEGIDRPAVIKQFESLQRPFWMLDLGANIVSKSETLVQFARLGVAYASEIGGIGQPAVALLNIGVEQSKGPTLQRDAASELESSSWCNFHGFLEPNHLFEGHVDVVVTDGYAGNIALKSVEGTARFIREVFLNEFSSDNDNDPSQAVRKRSRKKFSRLMKKLDSHRHNGASFVGLNGVVVKSHNSTTERGMTAAVKQTIGEIEADMPRKIQNYFKT